MAPAEMIFFKHSKFIRYICIYVYLHIYIYIYTGADPGFPVGGAREPSGGVPTYDFAKFCEKMHEIEKILGHGGGGAHRARPPKSATDIYLEYAHPLGTKLLHFYAVFGEKIRRPSGKS